MHTCVVMHNKSFAVTAHSLWLKLDLQLHGLPHVKSSRRWLHGERPAAHRATDYQSTFLTSVRGGEDTGVLVRQAAQTRHRNSVIRK